MSSIDTRIVEMKFNNTQFMAGVRETMSAISTLDKSLKMEGAGKGLADLNAAGKRVDLGHIASAVDGISSKFSAMGVVAATALSNLTSKAMNAGMNITKALTISPITSGFHEYETGIKSVQTILANTQAAGTTLPQVNKSLADLNRYADQTIYSFSEMTKNIGTFTAAGVDLKTAQGSIKGIANLAALSGSNSQQASTAMYQLSQAISSGKVSLMDWNSVVNAGMGGTVFQRALAQTAVQMGTLDKSSLKLSGSMKNVKIDGQSFRDSISAENGKSWLTSDVLTNTLRQLSGDMTDAELKAQGFTAAQIKSIQAQAKTAKDAATQVKTLSQLYETTKEAVGSGWATTFQTLFGDFAEAKTLFTGINKVVSDAVGKSADARNKMLGDWKAMGGRTELLAGLKNLFQAFGSVIKPIKEAFREIFPPTTAKQLLSMTKSFRAFTEKLKMGGETAKNLKATFKGVFAIFGIGWEIIKKVVGVFAGLFKTASGGTGSFLKITAAVGNFLTKLHSAIKNGEGLTKFFDGLGTVLAIPINAFKALLGNADSLGGALSKLGQAVSTAWSIIANGEFKGGLWDEDSPIVANLFKIRDALVKAGDAIKSFFKSLTGGFNDSAGNFNFDAILGILSVGLFAGVFKLFKTLREKILGPDGIRGILAGALEAITSPFESLTDTLDQMQNTLRATTLLQIAIAVGVLAASVVALSKIDSDDLKKALTAMGVAFGQLMIAMAIFQKISITTGMSQLILMALAIRVLTSAVKELAKLDWEELGKGLAGTAGLLLMLAGAAQLMPDGKKMISSSIGLLIMAGAIKVLVGAVKDLSELDWEELGKGLVGVGGLLASLALFTRLAAVGKAGVLQGAGIILLAVGIRLLHGAVKDFSDMNWEDMAKGLLGVAGGLLIMGAALALIPPTSIFSAVGVLLVASSLGMIGDAMKQMGNMDWKNMAKGLVAMAGALTLIGLALTLIPPTSLLSAAAIFIVAGTLSTIGDALEQMGNMDWENIAKGLVALAGSLGIIAIALYAMTGTLAGAAALYIVAAALGTIAPILTTFGEMSWEEIGKGLLMLAGAFTAIGLAGLILAPIVPALLGLGAAIALIGAGAALAGVGLLAMGAGLALIATAGAGAVAILMLLLQGIISLIPSLMVAVGQGLIGLAQVIITAGPTITQAFTTILSSMIQAVINVIPQIGQLISTLLTTILGLINKHAPQIIETFISIARKFLAGVRALLPDILATFSAIITGILGLVNKHAPQIIDTFVSIARKFLAGVRALMPDILATFTDIILGILGVIRRLTPEVIGTIMFMLESLLRAIVGFVPKLVRAGMDIIVGFLNGIAQKIGNVVTAAVNIIVAFIDGITSNLPRIIQSGVNLILAFINGLANAIRNNSSEMGAAGGNLASAMIEGMVRGLGSGLKRVVSSAVNLAKSAVNAAKNALGINSPSKEFMALGKWSAEGYAKGLTGNQDQITAATATMQKALKDALTAEQKNIKSLESKLVTLNKNRRKNAKAIQDTTAALKEAKHEYNKTIRAQQLFNTYGDETARLKSMANSIADFGTKIDEAKKKVEEATKVRNDYAKSVEDQYDNLPDISKETKLPDFIKSLQKQIVDTQIFKAQLKKLKELGINDEMYKMLVSKGVDAIPFVTQILDRGKNGVDELNTLGRALDITATKLGIDASKALYQAGVDAAAGLVKGLENKKAALQKQMNALAASMVSAIKKSLGIRSPSLVFMEVGGWSVEGLAKGLLASNAANKAAGRVGQDAVDSMKKSMMKSSVATDMFDLRPQITPVLDLSSIAKDAEQLGSMLNVAPLSVAGSYAVASNMASIMNRQNGSDSDASSNGGTQQAITFNQYNNSPKELSSADIYRQTKNQLSRAREALNN